ncbi:MAG: ABC transporter substrate-binding protein, partial [Brasilonema sp.]
AKPSKQVSSQKIAVFWSPDSNFSKSLRGEFSNAFGATRLIKDSNLFNLSHRNFNPVDALQEAKNQGATAVVLIPDAGTTPDALDNALKVIKFNNDPNLMMLAGDSLYGSKVLETEIAQKAVNRLVVAIAWHKLSIPDLEFLKLARKLWGTEDVSWRTAATYDATRVLIEAIKQQPSREGIRKVLSQDKVIVTGSATGDINFEKSERVDPKVALVTVVPYCSPASGYSFVPIELAGAKCFQPTPNQETKVIRP